MFNLGMGEITVILLLALIFLGPKKIPELASGLGKLIREFRKATSDVKNEIALDETFRKPFEELRDAVTLHPEELKRRDQIKRDIEEMRRKAEEVERAQQAASSAETESGPPADAPPAAPASLVEPAAEIAPPPAVETAAAEAPPPSPAAPAVPHVAPPGTVAAPPTRLGPPRVTPPVSSADGDAGNKTQILSEADLISASAASAGPRRRPSTPPPLPGVAKPQNTKKS